MITFGDAWAIAAQPFAFSAALTGCMVGRHRWRRVAGYTPLGQRVNSRQCADCGATTLGKLS